MTHWSEALPSNVCSEAVEWARKQPDYATAWASCERVDWMLWLIGRLDTSAPMSDERRPLVRCAVEIAETVRYLMPPTGTACLDLVSRWCDGADVSTAELTVSAWDAAGAAAWAARAARAAAWAAGAAARAAAGAAGAAGDAEAAALRSYAEIVRRHYPTPPVLR